MSAKKRDISREEMRQYLDGKLVGRAAHDVERHLLENEFANEAIEGFEGFDQELIDEDIQHLKDQLTGKRRNRVFYYIAASVALLIVSLGSVWFMMDQVEDENALSYEEQSEVKKEEFTKQLQSQESPDQMNELEVKDEEPVIGKKQKERPAIENPDRSKVAVKQPIKKQTAPMEEEIEYEEVVVANEEYALAEVQREEELILEPIADLNKAEGDGYFDMDTSFELIEKKSISGKVTGDKIPLARMASANTKGKVDQMSFYDDPYQVEPKPSVSTDLRAHKISGQITDENGEPLPGVNVIIKGSANGTTSDLDGNYSLNVSDGMTLNFSFIGLESADIQVGSQETLNVELESDVNSLSEVVVTGYAESEEIEEGYEAAQPVDGVRSYKDYLESNLRYPEEAKQNGIEGKVILKLTLDEIGSVITIEVRRGLGFGCDEEAIRLVEEGPDWEPAIKDGVNISSSVRVKVKFELED